MKRSNRLVMLVGVFLAIVAFIGVILLMQGSPDGTTDPSAPPTELPTVVATADIPLGVRIQEDQVRIQVLPVDARLPGALQDVTQAVGQVVRVPVTTGQQITSETFASGGQIQNIVCPPGRVCMAVQVDQVTGVGTVIKTADYVDMVVGFTGAQFPVITLNPLDDSFTVVSGLNSTSVKALLQGLQVMGTLLPPPPAQDPNAPAPSGDPSTTLSGQQQIVILSVTTQQSEVIKFAQLDGSISLVLRSPDDFIDPATNQPIPVPEQVPTTGVILKTLVDTYGVLPPELVETVLPAQEANP